MYLLKKKRTTLKSESQCLTQNENHYKSAVVFLLSKTYFLFPRTIVACETPAHLSPPAVLAFSLYGEDNNRKLPSRTSILNN